MSSQGTYARCKELDAKLHGGAGCLGNDIFVNRNYQPVDVEPFFNNFGARCGN